MSMRRAVCLMVVVGASLAWPCSGEVCNRDGQFSTLDGGVPSNLFPLVLTDLWNAYGFQSGGAQVRLTDGGLVLTQVRVIDPLSLAVETPLLVEGERYHLQRLGGCASPFGGDAGVFTEDFNVLPPIALPSQGVSLEVADAGSGLVNQYSGASCFEGVPASFAVFRFVVTPAMAPLLPFYAWRLELAPLDGGSLVEWHTEPVGGLLGDGSLRRVPNAQLAPTRIGTVFHACAGDGGFPASLGVPSGQYRGVLSARLLGTDAGFVTTSAGFELAQCAELPAPDAGVDAGVDAGSSPVDGGGAAPSIIGPAPHGCAVTGGETLLLLAALGLLRRRHSSSEAG